MDHTTALPGSTGQPDPLLVARALARITQLVGGGHRLERVFEAFADEIDALFPYDRCSIMLLDAHGEQLRDAAVRDRLPHPIDDGARPIDGAAGGWVIAARRSLIRDLDRDEADDPVRFTTDIARRAAGIQQYVVVPVLIDQEPVGVFGLSSRQAGVYRSRDLWILETIADHLGLAIAATNLRRDAEHRARNGQFLADTAALFASSLDLEQTLQTAAGRAADVLGDLNAVFLLDEATGMPMIRALTLPDDVAAPLIQEIVTREEWGLGGRVIGPAVAGTPVLIAELQQEQIWPEMRGIVDQLGIHSVLAVPLIAGGQQVGVLASARSGAVSIPLTEDDLSLARDFGAQLGSAILTARLHAATQRALDESEALRRIGRELAGTIDLDRVLGLVSTFAQLLLHADYAAVATHDRNGAFPWRGFVGQRTDAHLTTRYLPGQGTVGRAVATREPVILEGFPDNRSFPVEEFPIELAEEMRSGIGIPLLAGPRVLGALIVGYRTPRKIVDDDVRLAAALADQAAIVLENARLFDEAQRAIAHRDDFLAVASHELRTPLTSLRGRAQLLERRASNDLTPGDRESLHIILQQIDQFGRLVDDLLTASDLGDGALPLKRRPTDLVELARRVASAPGARRGRAEVSVIADVPSVVGDWDTWRIEHALTNLLENARKYSDEQTPITLRIGSDDHSARIEVIDRGQGIAPDDLDRIFDRFYRGDDDTRGGIGLGLAVARRLIREHEGELWATSPGPGQGATFVVTLPLVPSAPHAAEAGAAAPERGAVAR